MNPYEGDVYALREQLLGEAEVGERIDVAEMRRRLAEIGDATEDEIAAATQELLVRVDEAAARKLMLGEREQERRRRRRKAERRARRRNR